MLREGQTEHGGSNVSPELLASPLLYVSAATEQLEQVRMQTANVTNAAATR